MVRLKGQGESSAYGSMDTLAGVSAEERLKLLESPKRRRTDDDALTALRETLSTAILAPKTPIPIEPASEFSQTIILLVSCLLAFAAAATALSLVPLFQSLRSSIGFSSFQVCFLNAAPLLFSAVTTLVVNNFVQSSPLWDVLAWASLCLALGCWIASCSHYGSPLEYLALGQLFVGVTIAFLSGTPAKLCAFWISVDKHAWTHTLWVCSVLLGSSFAFLAVPPMVGGDGQGKHLGSFLLWRAILATGLSAAVIGVRAGMVPSSGPERDESLLYRYRSSSETTMSFSELVQNKKLMYVVIALGLAMGGIFSFFMLLPYLLSLPPHNYTPLQAGHVLCLLGPMGIVGLFVVKGNVLDLPNSGRYKQPILVAIGGTAFFIFIFVMVLGRTHELGLALVGGAVFLFAAPLVFFTQQVTTDLSYPHAEHVSSVVVTAIMELIVSLCPLISVALTHPFVAEYDSEDSSPTGWILSYGSAFWMLLFGASFLMIVTLYKDDERKIFIDSHPQVIASLTEKVASDLSQARAFSEMVIPMPEKFAREEERMFEPERRDPRDLRWSQQGV
mmetsp:Transcript_21272/g.70558  ORF Transcript_21272/g.70558 Transcript_21272/m.70558 type:complete len:560 (-) Transcript_21272:88-1767(-)